MVCEFHDCAPDTVYPGMALVGSELYFVGDDENPEKSEYGGYCWGNSGGYHYLCSIDLDTGEYTNHGSIYDGDKEYEGANYSSCANIYGVYNGKIYVRYSFIKDMDLWEGCTNADDIYTHINFEIDPDSKTWKEAELPPSVAMNENTYTWYDKENRMMHVIYNGTDMDFPWEISTSIFDEYNGMVFANYEKTFVDLSDMSVHGYGEYEDYAVMGWHNGSYILRKCNDFIRLTRDELLASAN